MLPEPRMGRPGIGRPSLGTMAEGTVRQPVGLPCPVSPALSVTGKDVGSTLLALFHAELQGGQRKKWDILSALSQPGWWMEVQEGGGGPKQGVISMQIERVGALEGCGCD